MGTSVAGMRDQAVQRLRLDSLNWRLMLVRTLSSGASVVATVLLLPGVRFTGWSWGFFVLVGVVFGLLNAFLKPLIQFFALRYLVASYGLVVLLINAFLLWLLARILDDRIAFGGLLQVLVGGLVVGLLGLFFDTLLGTTPPTLDDPASGFEAAEHEPEAAA